MLLGVRERRGDELVATATGCAIYVPFGQHWYEYSLRRLQENPKHRRLRRGATLLNRFVPGR